MQDGLAHLVKGAEPKKLMKQWGERTSGGAHIGDARRAGGNGEEMEAFELAELRVPVCDTSACQISVVLRELGGIGGDVFVFNRSIEAHGAVIDFDQKQGAFAALTVAQSKARVRDDLVGWVGGVRDIVGGFAPEALADLLAAVLHQGAEKFVVL